eukprot:14208601-Alexandrium_andersonii.AAC.1
MHMCRSTGVNQARKHTHSCVHMLWAHMRLHARACACMRAHAGAHFCPGIGTWIGQMTAHARLMQQRAAANCHSVRLCPCLLACS